MIDWAGVSPRMSLEDLAPFGTGDQIQEIEVDESSMFVGELAEKIATWPVPRRRDDFDISFRLKKLKVIRKGTEPREYPSRIRAVLGEMSTLVVRRRESGLLEFTDSTERTIRIIKKGHFEFLKLTRRHHVR